MQMHVSESLTRGKGRKRKMLLHFGALQIAHMPIKAKHIHLFKNLLANGTTSACFSVIIATTASHISTYRMNVASVRSYEVERGLHLQGPVVFPYI